jgi:hypothetical protein
MAGRFADTGISAVKSFPHRAARAGDRTIEYRWDGEILHGRRQADTESRFASESDL